MSWNGLRKNILNLTFFLHIKTFIAAVNLKSDSSVLKFCLLHDISFYGRVEGLK